jgi:amidase
LVPQPELADWSIADLSSRLDSGELSVRRLAEMHLERIAAIDQVGPGLRSVIEINPDWEEIAERLDRERNEGQVRGPLHGVPVLVKDNIDTGDRMQTTAGSLALLGMPAPADAPLVARLRAAGVLVLGKTNLSEWANFRSSRSSGGWSARGRQCRNPHVLDRSPCGSSSGSAVAVAAGLIPVAVGTETDGSIICPSSANGVVGIKPAVGLVSQQGIIPISRSQDSAGPHARYVRDAALLLGALVDVPTDFTAHLDTGALRGRRLGVLREPYTGYSEHTDKVHDAALLGLRDLGAELIEVEISTAKAMRADERKVETTVMQYEFKAGIDSYLAGRPEIRPRSLADLIRFNQEHAADEMPYFPPGNLRSVPVEVRPRFRRLHFRAGRVASAVARGWHRRHAQQAQARRTRRALTATRLGDRSDQWRPRHRRLDPAVGDGGLPDSDSASRDGLRRATPWPRFFREARLGGSAARNGLRLRAAD